MLSCMAIASETQPIVTIQTQQDWVSSGAALNGVVSIRAEKPASTVRVEYSTEKSSGEVVASMDANDTSAFTFQIPPLGNTSPATLTLRAVAIFSESSKSPVNSESRTIPVALEQELDITGDAAVALLYPIGGPEYTVRYVPCCNIFGGITMATRVPVNPEKSATGLPEKILSDFIVLSPDGLSASTMGMYMDFLLGADRFKGVTPALYEFNGREWVEYASYTVDAARGYLTMHCPNGGTFVIAAKP